MKRRVRSNNFASVRNRLEFEGVVYLPLYVFIHILMDLYLYLISSMLSLHVVIFEVTHTLSSRNVFLIY